MRGASLYKLHQKEPFSYFGAFVYNKNAYIYLVAYFILYIYSSIIIFLYFFISGIICFFFWNFWCFEQFLIKLGSVKLGLVAKDRHYIQISTFLRPKNLKSHHFLNKSTK